MRFQTKAIHTGVEKDTAYNSIVTPIYQTSTFRFEDIGKTKGYDYTRSGNPTRTALEENIADLEGGIAARATATGMAAISTVLHLFKPGDHIACTNDCYGGTERVLRLFHESCGMDVSYVDMTDTAAVERAISPKTRALWIETPSNPLLNVSDIQSLADIAHHHGALAIVDNTFLSPYNQRPFQLGADIIVHSTTKYLNGHSDVVGGAIVANRSDLAEKIAYAVNALGQGASPFDCWLVLRGIKTLVARMRLHEENAMAVAEFLERHPAVSKVFYPGLVSHPHHLLAKKQQTGFGGMVSFEIRGGITEIRKLLRATRVFAVAESLGGIESLICHPATMTHASMDPVLREQAGITDKIIRLSVGIEDRQDLLEDLAQALQ